MRPALALAAVGLAALAGACRAPASPAPPRVHGPAPLASADVAFVDVTVLPLDADRALPHHTVLIRGDRIAAIFPTEQAGPRALPAATRVVDGRGKFLLPGLADMHTHLNHEEDLRLYVARGVTTVRNMWGAPLHLRWRREIAAGARLGPTIVTAGPIIDGEDPIHDGSLVVRGPAGAAEVVALHRAFGYDFIKVYNHLPLSVYDALVASARGTGLDIAGHTPDAVGLEHVIASEQRSVEHMHGIVDAAQPPGSPARGRFDPASRAQKLTVADPARLPEIAKGLAARGVWSCPTRVVMDAWAPAAEVRRRLAQPEQRYVPAASRAAWEPGADDAGELARDAAWVRLIDAAVRAVHAAGGRLLAGTDPGNPLVVPGFALHDELAHLVRLGLTPYEALRVATHDAAEFLHAEAEVGTIAPGKRADLLLLDRDPRADIAATKAIAGVMARGRWVQASELDALLVEAARTIDGVETAFAGLPALTGAADTPELEATFDVIWRDVHFGSERVMIGRDEGGDRRVRAQALNAHSGQRTTLALESGRFLLESDGPQGRGRVAIERRAGAPHVHLTGTLLPGLALARDEPLAPSVELTAAGFVAPSILLALRAARLGPGGALELPRREVALGSDVTLTERPVVVTRVPDATLTTTRGPLAVRRFEVTPAGGARGPVTLLSVDAGGWLVRAEARAHGAVLRFERR
mgnify:CR=1 FL=1